VNESLKLKPEASEARFEVELKEGPTQLMTWLVRENDDQSGAYYTRVRYLGPKDSK
jgi:hypothetical protein